jgi:hypothetical protein
MATVNEPELENETVSFLAVSAKPAPTSHFLPLIYQPEEIVETSVKMNELPL